MQINYEEGTPPAVLYHGTAKRFLDSIKKEGLKPMSRQYVHLSEDTETAKMVGKRRDSDPVILRIDTAEAMKAGVKFYRANDKVWLCKQLPSQFIK
jgi:putative RNA 2'-phosphotransferase